jgi:uncharacterized protein YoxC
MGPGGIATIIAACSLLVIAVIDEAKLSLKTVVDETKPLIEEVTTTVKLVNGPLESLNKITKSAENVSSKVSDVATSFMDKGGPAVKVLGLLMSAAKFKQSRNQKKKG